MLVAYVSQLPILLLGNLLLIAVAVGIGVLMQNRRHGIVVAAIAVVPSAAFWVAFLFCTGVQRQMAFDMDWSYGEKWKSYPDADYIVLRFKSQPHHFVGIVSRDLGRYLETLPSRDVRVVFDVTLDFGRTRGFHEVQIGKLQSWNSLNGCAGVRGNSDPSPWP
jgi:hypothetical protein